MKNLRGPAAASRPGLSIRFYARSQAISQTILGGDGVSVVHGLFQRVSALGAAKLGRCAKCMGLSLSGAVIGWLVLAGVVSYWPQFPFTNLLALWPASFTTLWVLHILTFGGRVVATQHRAQQDAVPATGPVMTRRLMLRTVGELGVFAGAVGLATLLSAKAAAASCIHVGAQCATCASSGTKDPTTGRWSGATCTTATDPCCNQNGGCRPVYDRTLGCVFCTCQI